MSGNSLSIEEQKQIIFLQRQFTNIETMKTYRLQIPLIFNGLVLAIAALILNSTIIPANNIQQNLLITVVLTVQAFGLLVFWQYHKSYNRLVDQIHHIYDKLEIIGDKFFIKDKPMDYIRLKTLHLILYLSFIVFASIALVAIIYGPSLSKISTIPSVDIRGSDATNKTDDGIGGKADQKGHHLQRELRVTH